MGIFGHRIWRSIWTGRIALIFVGLSILLAGVRALDAGRLHYQNYWGGLVFAPLAIAIGVAVLILVVVKCRTLNETGPRLKGKAARRARKAAETRSPIDSFDKPWNP
jgi:hypothetical protein